MMITQNLLNFFKVRPEAWLGGLVINQSHYAIVLGVIMFSKWQSAPIFHPQTWWYLLGLSLALCLSSWAKVRLTSGFHTYYHLKSVKNCPWCGREAVGYNPNLASINWGMLKRNILFSILMLSILSTVWLPIIAHHLWVDTKFENLAFLVSLTVAVLVSIFGAVAELVFAYCTTIYKLNWSNSILITINFLMLKWGLIIKLVVIGTFWFTLVGGAVIYLFQPLGFDLITLLLLILLGSFLQVYWLVHLDKALLTLNDGQLLGKLRAMVSPTAP